MAVRAGAQVGQVTGEAWVKRGTGTGPGVNLGMFDSTVMTEIYAGGDDDVEEGEGDDQGEDDSPQEDAEEEPEDDEDDEVETMELVRNLPSDPEGVSVSYRFAKWRTHLAWREDGHNQIRLIPDLAARVAYLHVRVVQVCRQQRPPWSGLDGQEEEAVAVGFTYGGRSIESPLWTRCWSWLLHT